MIKRSLSVAAVLLLAGLAAPTPAEAYNTGWCGQGTGGGQVESIDKPRIDSGATNRYGRADFGDDPHWFGAPQNPGYICWIASGNVQVFGRLFADSVPTVNVSLQIDFHRAGATNSSVSRYLTFEGSYGGSVPVEWAALAGSGARYTKVCLHLASRYGANWNPDYSKCFRR